MLLLAFLLLALVLWWTARPPVRGARRRRTVVVTAPPARPAPAPTREQAQPAAGPGAEPPLTEDDVIAFGLALEATWDVARAALTDPRRGPSELRQRRDVPGPS